MVTVLRLPVLDTGLPEGIFNKDEERQVVAVVNGTAVAPTK